MKKDVVYIDIEDDITAIIDKVKSTESKVVALVPPKRIGALQSAVNLKLLQRTAQHAGKHVVLISSEKALLSLAAGVRIPVAKNLQSRPELVDMPEAPEADDIINGSELPIGEIAAAAEGKKAGDSSPKSAADTISEELEIPAKDNTEKAKPKKSGPKVPNFNLFRKRFLFIGLGAIILVGFLMWALVIAPKATVTISAKTSAVNIDRTLGLQPALGSSEVDQSKLKPLVKQTKKTNSTNFTATGTKDIGEKAKGSVTIKNSFDSDPVNVPAGTTFTAAGGQKFVSTSGVMIPGAKVSGGGIIAGTASVTLQAADVGPEYNIESQSYKIQGFDNLQVPNADAMRGGTKEKVTVVSQADIDKAKEQLAQQDENTVKNELKAQFGADFQVIEESYQREPGNPSASPAVGDQAKEGKVTVETTFTYVGIARADIKKILDTTLKDAIGEDQNKGVFSSGENSVSFQAFQRLDGGNYAVRLVTTGYIGVKIDPNELAKKLAGKRYGDIENTVNALPGVTKVDIAFSPFWVTAAPNDPNKVEIKFSVANDTN